MNNIQDAVYTITLDNDVSLDYNGMGAAVTAALFYI